MTISTPQDDQRSSSGNANPLLGLRPDSAASTMPSYSLLTWIFGRGTVIWRIWPAVFLHTVFAAAVVTLTMRGVVDLKIPSVMLTVLGVVIGFVISYRASSGYDRYWQGRKCWSEVMRNVRTIGRLIWFHVPPRLTRRTSEEVEFRGPRRSAREMKKVMAEKKLALDLVEGFAVALKHHIRGELGIYYQDLYHLIKPLHDVSASTLSTNVSPPVPTSAILPYTNPIIPPINSYGTFDPSLLHTPPLIHRSSNSTSSLNSDHTLPLLLPNQLPTERTLLSKVSRDLIPFSSILITCRNLFSTRRSHLSPERDQHARDPFDPHPIRSWRGLVYSGLRTKQRPYVAGGGENLPVEILRHISDWFSAIEDRGTVPGTSMGQMIGILAAFEENLTTLECILTTPLPFVYSAHIRTVWIYLFFLPFQLVEQFGWFTIPGVAMAAFIYLGFVAAGEEIEQPFGYDENDLDLDLFCREIIHNDIQSLKITPCDNAFLDLKIQQRPDIVHRQSMTLIQLADKHHEQLS